MDTGHFQYVVEEWRHGPDRREGGGQTITQTWKLSRWKVKRNEKPNRNWHKSCKNPKPNNKSTFATDEQWNWTRSSFRCGQDWEIVGLLQGLDIVDSRRQKQCNASEKSLPLVLLLLLADGLQSLSSAEVQILSAGAGAGAGYRDGWTEPGTLARSGRRCGRRRSWWK